MRLEVEDRWHDLQVDHGVLMAFYTQFGTQWGWFKVLVTKPDLLVVSS